MHKKALVFLTLTVNFLIFSQNEEKKIDQLFSSLIKDNAPGLVVSVTKNGESQFSEAYGKSNIAYDIENTTKTLFNIGSVSKQFTAMGIVLLEQEGKLSFKDDIRTYLPEIPDFGKKISISDLLHHTSGLRATPELLGLAGWREGDAFSNEDIFRFMQKQKRLNFEPGSAYMYSNTNYVLLARIIEVITKENFKKWTKDHIFDKLNMNSTFVEEDISILTKAIATSYEEIEQSVFKYIENNDLTYGASNIYTNTIDLHKWNTNFHSPSKSWEKAFETLKTLDTLSNGRSHNYAFGIMKDDYLGNTKFQHTGGIAGFRSIMVCFPDEKLEIIILTNFHSSKIKSIADQIASLYLKDKSTKIEISDAKIEKNHVISIDIMNSYIGNYWNDVENYSRQIYVEANSLWYLRTNVSKSKLTPINDSVFKMDGVSENIQLIFHKNSNKMSFISETKIDVFERYEDLEKNEMELKLYSGKFYSEELETFYIIGLKNGALFGYQTRFGEFEIKVLKKNITDWSGMAISKYKKNNNGEIIGFTLDLNGVKNVFFEKL